MFKKYRTFTGSDALVFVIFPECKPICLGSLTTISFSTYRAKVPVFSLGKIGTTGFTRGIRSVGGTLIFTMLNQNWMNEVKDELTGLNDYKQKIKSDEVPPFDLMIVCANEYGASTLGYIYGVEITDEGQVLSIEEIFTENQCKFQARDIDWFEEDKISGKIIGGSSSVSSFNISFPSEEGDFSNYEANFNTRSVSLINSLKEINVNKSHDYANIEANLEELINGEVFFSFQDLKGKNNFKISYIVKYNEETVTESRILNTEETSVKIGTDSITNAFVFNPKYNAIAEKIDFVVYPFGYKPLKYSISVKG